MNWKKVAIALGVAKGALECFADLAQSKIPMLSSSTLKHRPIAQYPQQVLELHSVRSLQRVGRRTASNICASARSDPPLIAVWRRNQHRYLS